MPIKLTFYQSLAIVCIAETKGTLKMNLTNCKTATTNTSSASTIIEIQIILNYTFYLRDEKNQQKHLQCNCNNPQTIWYHTSMCANANANWTLTQKELTERRMSEMEMERFFLRLFFDDYYFLGVMHGANNQTSVLFDCEVFKASVNCSSTGINEAVSNQQQHSNFQLHWNNHVGYSEHAHTK